MIVKLFHYSVRNQIFISKGQLKGTGITISENLTQLRQSLLKAAQNNSKIDRAWTIDGRIVCPVNNRRIHITNHSQLHKL